MSALELHGSGKAIAEVLSRLGRSVKRGSSLPILSCVHIYVGPDQVVMAEVTSLDQWHSAPLPCDLQDGAPGDAFCVSLHLLASLVGRCNGDGIRARWEKDALTVEAGGRRAKLLTLPAVEWPAQSSMPDPDEAISINGPVLAAAMRSVEYCQSDDDTRYVLNGICITSDREVVTTDGRRLAKTEVSEIDLPLDTSREIIIPTPAVAPLCDLLSRGSDHRLHITESGIAIWAGAERYITKRIEGNYPNWKQVIPNYDRSCPRITVDRESLSKGLDWVRTVMTKTGQVRIHCEGETMRLSIESPEVGEMSEDIPLAQSLAEPIQICVSVEFLRSFASPGSGPISLVCGQYGVAASAIQILSDDPASPWLGILMPMRIN